jgi:hypothetical protein
VTEELTASWFGWPVRTFEAAVRPGALRPSFRTDADGFVETTIPLSDARFRQPSAGSVAS